MKRALRVSVEVNWELHARPALNVMVTMAGNVQIGLFLTVEHLRDLNVLLVLIVVKLKQMPDRTIKYGATVFGVLHALRILMTSHVIQSNHIHADPGTEQALQVLNVSNQADATANSLIIMWITKSNAMD